MLLVNESLALALQFAGIPPFAVKRFVGVDFGASKVTVSAYELEQSDGSHGVAYVLKEVGSRTNMFMSGSEVEYRMMTWCEKHKAHIRTKYFLSDFIYIVIILGR